MRGEQEAPIYPSHDWYNQPVQSSLLAVACLVLLCVFFFMLVKVGDYKINKKFKDGQVISLESVVEQGQTNERSV